MMKINSSVRTCVFSKKWVKFTQDELFSIFHFKSTCQKSIKMPEKVYYFHLTMYSMEKILFWGQIFKMEILVGLSVFRSSESKFAILAVALCVCVITLTPKQITIVSPNVVLYILVTSRSYLKPFAKIGVIACTRLKNKDWK